MTPTTFTLRAISLVLLALPLASQSRNVTLLSNTNPPGDSRFADVWGYVDPATGREYAILLSRTGTYIYDATDPRRPAQRAFFRGATSTWRDARTYGHYLYVVTEAASGMQIIDLQNPNSPRMVRTHDYSGWNRTHNISIDLDTGLCYPCGTSSGTLVFDLSQNPTNPPLVGNYRAEYVHDLQVQNGYGYLAEINRDRLRVVDLSNPGNIRSLDTWSVDTCHNAWPTRDDKFCVATSETNGPGLTVLDVRDKSQINEISRYTLGGTIHNAQVDDRLVHISYYGFGYRCVDLSAPWNPVEVGYYDSGSDWGVYAFQPSGVIYASDMSLGLEIFRPKATAEDYGTATPGSSSPTLHTFGSAWLGNQDFRLELDDGPANANAFFLLGSTRASVDVSGLTVLIDLNRTAVTLSTATDSSGDAFATIPIPTSTSLDGLRLHAQGLVLDSGGPLGLAATDGKTFELFRR